MVGSSNSKALHKKYKPHIVMVLVQIGYTFLYFITEASFRHGMNPHVYVTYRSILAGIVLLPFAYVLESKLRPKMTFLLFGEIFVLSLFGIGLTLNMYFVSMTYTSPSFITSMLNTISSLTFLIAIILRLEIVDIQNPRGIAKVLGTLISLAGVMTMSLYKGSIIRNIVHPLIRIQGRAAVHEEWVKGSVLTVASCISLSFWYIMQAYTLKRYPAQLSLTTCMSFLGAAQSAAYTLCVQPRPDAWTIGLNIDLWSTVYGGVVVSGLVNYAVLWCNEEKGPVFVTIFSPLLTLLVALLAYFVFGERLYVGSILGGATVIVGLYLLLWGKEGDQASTKFNDDSTSTCQDSNPI